jgi:endo-1,4-beta-xylanase
MLDVWLPKSAGPAELERQATIFRDVFTTALAAQKCPAIFLWGFTDRHSWIPGISNGTFDHALIFDRGFRPKPAYEAISSTAAGAPGLPGGPFRRTRPWLKAAGEWRAEGSSLDSALKPGKPPSASEA